MSRLTQEMRDAARMLRTPREKEVYLTFLTRRWQSAIDRRQQNLLDSLVEKDWADKTRKDGEWVYQRRHSLDEGE